MTTPIPQARQVSLLRLLLLAVALGVVEFAIDPRLGREAPDTLAAVRWLLVSVAVASALLAASVSWVRRNWQLALHLVFDLLWIGLLIFGTGGVSSPAVVLLFAVILTGNLVVRGMPAFVLPALASLVLAGIAALYLAGRPPFPSGYLELAPHLGNISGILGNLAVQTAACFLVDILGQLLEHRLREQRIFTGELLDQLGEGVLAVDRSGQVAYANAEAARLLGLPENGVDGLPVSQVLAGDRLAEPRRLVTSGAGSSLERWTGPDGRQLVLRTTTLLGRKGQTLGRTLLVADETRLRLLEENARRAEHLASLGEMAAGIAHEVRNPLTSLRGCAQELGELLTRHGDGDAAAMARIIVDESDRLNRIVNDFLALSRMRQPERKEVDLAHLFSELRLLTSSRRDLPLGMRCQLEVSPDCPHAHADPDQLRQLLSNLINNAIDACLHTAGPRLECRAIRADEGNPLDCEAVLLLVRDNGCGMDPSTRDRAFTPFFSTKAQGTGLGLSLVSRIVREHEGLLEVDSEPGRGTTFRILLPARSQTREYRRALGR